MRAYAYVYERGKRVTNQDSILIEKMNCRGDDVVLAAVCDGMGGMDHGEIASGYIVEQCGIWFYEKLQGLLKHFGSYQVEKSFRQLCYQMHNSLKDYGVRRSMHLGSTMSVFLSVGARALVFHLGDTAVFRVWPSGKRLTKIHSKDGELTRCLGLGKYIAPDLKRLHIHKGESYLLCSDGLLHQFSDQDFKNVLGDGKNCERQLNTLVKTAYRRGEEDNISAIFLQV